MTHRLFLKYLEKPYHRSLNRKPNIIDQTNLRYIEIHEAINARRPLPNTLGQEQNGRHFADKISK